LSYEAAACFQLVFILLGICAGGQFTTGKRGKDAALDAACRSLSGVKV
jgi:hypothetical protein